MRPSADALGTLPEIVGLERGSDPQKPIVVIANAETSEEDVELTYTIQVSTQEDFETIVDREGNIVENRSGSTRWRVERALDETETYWFRARVNDGRFDGPWSDSVALRTTDAQLASATEDVDGDGIVSFQDFFILASGYGSTDATLDLDGGGVVDDEDVLRFKKRFGHTGSGKATSVRRVEIAEGSQVALQADAISADRIRVRVAMDGIEQMSGYGLQIVADPPILRFAGRGDSLRFGGKDAGIELIHDETYAFYIGEHVRGLRSSLDTSDGWGVDLLFDLRGVPQNIELRIESGFIGVGRGHMQRIEHTGSVRVIPQVYALYANYPNPFNPSTMIPLSIPARSLDQLRGRIELTVHNALGQVVRAWDLSTWDAGFHTLMWDGRDAQGRSVASGVYLIRLRADHFVQVRKALLVR
tara:strand:- start:29 stop:1276 length:1248 start_codon:yes stop_codon:yes gene_type:complete